MDDECLSVAKEFTGSAVDPTSLHGLHELIGVRGRVGLAVLRAELDDLDVRPRSPGEGPERTGELLRRSACSRCSKGVSRRQPSRFAGRSIRGPQQALLRAIEPT